MISIHPEHSQPVVLAMEVVGRFSEIGSSISKSSSTCPQRIPQQTRINSYSLNPWINWMLVYFRQFWGGFPNPTNHLKMGNAWSGWNKVPTKIDESSGGDALKLHKHRSIMTTVEDSWPGLIEILRLTVSNWPPHNYYSTTSLNLFGSSLQTKLSSSRWFRSEEIPTISNPAIVKLVCCKSSQVQSCTHSPWFQRTHPVSRWQFMLLSNITTSTEIKVRCHVILIFFVLLDKTSLKKASMHSKRCRFSCYRKENRGSWWNLLRRPPNMDL